MRVAPVVLFVSLLVWFTVTMIGVILVLEAGGEKMDEFTAVLIGFLLVTLGLFTVRARR